MGKFETLSAAAMKLSQEKNQEVIKSALDKEKMSEWLGLAQNTFLNSDTFNYMFNRLKEIWEIEKKDKSLSTSIVSRNANVRAAIRKSLKSNPSLPKEIMYKIIAKPTNAVNSSSILSNPSLDEKALNIFFDTHILAGDNLFMSIFISSIMNAKNVTQALADEWWDKLQPRAKWDYTNYWSAVVQEYLSFTETSTRILVMIASAPMDGKALRQSHSERFRQAAVKHKNATDSVKSAAYEITKNEEYLSDSAKVLFLF